MRQGCVKGCVRRRNAVQWRVQCGAYTWQSGKSRAASPRYLDRDHGLDMKGPACGEPDTASLSVADVATSDRVAEPLTGMYDFLNLYDYLRAMAYVQPPNVEIEWDRGGPRVLRGVTIRREIEGEWYAWRIPWNGVVRQAQAAELLDVSTMAVNNWVRSRRMEDIKLPGEPSMIPLREVKRIRDLLDGGNRLPPG